MSKPRDYRDDADVDEALDCIRIGDMQQARELFMNCLDFAYSQGRVDMLAEVIHDFANRVGNDTVRPFVKRGE